MDPNAYAAAMHDRLFYEACVDPGTSDDYINGYFSETINGGDSPSQADAESYAKYTRDHSDHGIPCYPLATFRTNIQSADLSVVTQQGNDWLAWILANTHLRKNENIDHANCGVFINKLDWWKLPEFCVLIHRKTNQSGIWYALPWLRFDWNRLTFVFNQTDADGVFVPGKDMTTPASYFTHPSFENLDQAQQQAEHRSLWKRIVSSALAIGETACFGREKNGAFWGAGVQTFKSLFDAETAPKASQVSDALSQLEDFITASDEKLVISNVTSIIKERDVQIEAFQNDLGRMQNEMTGDDYSPFMETLNTWRTTFEQYVSGESADQLQKALVDLTVNKYGGDGFPVFLAGVNVHNLCWQFYHALAYLCNIDSETRRSMAVRYLTEMADQWIKLTVRFAYESIDDRIRAQISTKDDDRTVMDKYTNEQMSIDKKKNPYADVNRYYFNVFAQWMSDNPDLATQILQLESAAALVGALVAMPPTSSVQKLDAQTISYNNVATTTGSIAAGNPATNWRDGRYIQYGVQFVFQDLLNGGKINQSDIFWSPQAQFGGWAWPHLVHIPVSHYYSAASRRLARRWGDLVNGAVVWQPERYLTVFNDSSDSAAPRQDEYWDEQE